MTIGHAAAQLKYLPFSRTTSSGDEKMEGF